MQDNVTKMNVLPTTPDSVEEVDYSYIMRVFRSVSLASDLRSSTLALINALGVGGNGIAGASLFLCDQRHAKQRMIPLASRRFPGHPGPFQISQSLLRQAWRERTVVWRLIDHGTLTVPSLIGVLPMLAAGDAKGLLHLEFAGVDSYDAGRFASSVMTLLEICAPVLELFKVTGGDNAVMLSMAHTINASVEAKDTYTSGHSERVARFTSVLADEMGLEEKQKQLLYISALCHDVGKIGISEQILRKPSLLSSEEFMEMQRHPVIGATIIQDLPGADLILGGIKHHHERWDGTGYPHGLHGEAIPLFARMIAVTDAFDAMTSGRAYSGFVEQQKAVDHLITCDDLFDKSILEALRKAHDAGSLTTRTGTNTHNRAA